jgi:hypothetical protein
MVHARDRDAERKAVAYKPFVAFDNNIQVLFHGERVPWWLTVSAVGQPGHASQFIENSAISKLVGGERQRRVSPSFRLTEVSSKQQTFIARLMTVRERERLKLAEEKLRLVRIVKRTIGRLTALILCYRHMKNRATSPR